MATGTGLPERVRITEVGPRDGFQMEQQQIPTALKVELIERLAAAGVDEIEAVSFVHPRVIPQMADAGEVLRRVERRPGVRYTALVPNLRGAERALDAGADALRLVVCCTETYNQTNVGLSIDESLELFGEIIALAEGGQVQVSVILAVAFGCPFEGTVPAARVLELARRFIDLGSRELGVADSAGLGQPLQVGSLIGQLRAQADTPLWLHLHDTRGLGLANALAGLEAGVARFDTSFGGLGGCPVMAGASGNIATEDFSYMCREMGLETGVDLDCVRQVSRRMEKFLGRELPSRILAAGTKEELYERNR